MPPRDPEPDRTQPEDPFSQPDSGAFLTPADAALFAERQKILKAGGIGRIAYYVSGVFRKLTGKGPINSVNDWGW